MRQFLRETIDAAQCPALRSQLSLFVQAVEAISYDLVNLADEWELERWYCFRVLRVHRLRFDLTLRAFYRQSRQQRSSMPEGGLRSECFRLVGECRKEVSRQLLWMDAGPVPTTDLEWERRLQEAVVIVRKHVDDLLEVLEELRKLAADKQETANRVQVDLQRIIKEF